MGLAAGSPYQQQSEQKKGGPSPVATVPSFCELLVWALWAAWTHGETLSRVHAAHSSLHSSTGSPWSPGSVTGLYLGNAPNVPAAWFIRST